jgi:hypothetical protein
MLALAVAAAAPSSIAPLLALAGDPAMHDPSTVVVHDGKFYASGTGGGLPVSVSDDGWTWRRAGILMQAVLAVAAARMCSRAVGTTRGRRT